MAFGGKLLPCLHMALVFGFAFHATKALMLPSQASSSLNTLQLTARAEQAVTLEPYTGNGAV